LQILLPVITITVVEMTKPAIKSIKRACADEKQLTWMSRYY
jgi:hypothetical protein